VTNQHPGFISPVLLRRKSALREAQATPRDGRLQAPIKSERAGSTRFEFKKASISASRLDLR
jgi:hypothetical protein